MLRLLLAGIISSSAWALANDCPVEQNLKPKMMNPDAFRQWLEENSESLKTVEDVICCLPASYKKNYVVTHSIRAGQNGSPESPRVLLFDSQKNSTTVIAFNGGDPYLNQPHNIELGYIRDNKKFEIYDIEFYKRFAQMSEKNPVRCLKCHADTVGGDARPFLHAFNGSSYVSGSVACSAEEDDLQNKVQAMATKSLIKNTRFACLDRGRPPSQENLKKLQSLFRSFAKHRLIQLMRNSKDFEAYKFVIAGAQICPNFKVAEWIPPEILSVHSQPAAVPHEISKEEQESRNKTLRRIQKSDFDLRRGVYRPTFQSGFCPLNPHFNKGREDLMEATTRLRFLFDGRGIETSTWTLSFNPQEDFQPFEPTASELVTERSCDKLKQSSLKALAALKPH